jgi:hypothetical protein
MFANCKKLITSPKIIQSSGGGRRLNQFLLGCTELTSVTLFEDESANDWNSNKCQMFAECPKLTHINYTASEPNWYNFNSDCGYRK